MKPNNPIRAAALVVVAIIGVYVMWMGYRINEILSGPGWCATALGAGKASSKNGAPIKGLEACVGLLTVQLKSLATNSHILFGVIALCLLVLIVIVIAGGRVAFKASRSGGEVDIVSADAPLPVTVANTQPIPVEPTKPAAQPIAPTAPVPEAKE